MRRTRLLLASFLSVSLLASGLDAIQAQPAVAAPAAADTQPEAVRAQEQARATGKRVEIVERRSDRATTFADPSGTLTTEIASNPVRIRRGGVWQDIDLTLRRAGARYAPTAAAADVSFSSGGRDSELVRLRVGERLVAVRWPSELPVASVVGGVATYRDVLPETDLELSTTASGYEKYLRLARPPANPVYRFDYRLSGLRLRKDAAGTLALVDARDAVVVRVPAPRMWDSSVDPATGDSGRSSEVATEVRDVKGGAELVLKPDASWLNDPATVYPVTVDPGATLSATADTWVQEGYSSSQYAHAQLRAGTYDGSTVARSMIKYDLAAYAGKHVTAATLKLYNHWSYSCTAAALNAYPLTAGFSSTTAWSNQPAHSTSTSWSGSGSFANGHTNCADGWGNVDVTKMVDGWTQGKLANYGLVLRASETSTAGWKKFCSANPSSATDMAPCSSPTYTPKFAITYNSFPSTPGTLSVAPCGYLCNTPAIARPADLLPTLTAQASDSDGNTLRYDFEVWEGGATAPTVRAAAGSVGPTTQNAKVSWKPSAALKENFTYEYRVRAWDGTDVSKPEWSSWFVFKLDRAAPAAPAMTSASHPDQNAWSRSSALSTSWTAPSDASGIQGYAVVADAAASTVPATTSALTTATTWSKTAADGVTVLHVRPVDKAGNWGATSHYRFQVDTVAPTLSISSTTHPDPGQWYGTGFTGALSTGPDTSGAASYIVAVDSRPDTEPTGVGQTSATVTTTQANGPRYLHARAVDKAGNVGPTTHYGFNVDAEAPAAPTASSASHPDQTAAYPGRDVQVTWMAPASTSPITGYAVSFDNAADTVPGPSVTQTILSFSTTVDNGTYWLHLRAVDRAGNWGPVRHRRVQVDTSLRPGPKITSSSHPDQQAWSENASGQATWAPSQAEGVSGYSVLLSDDPAAKPPTAESTKATVWSGALPDGERFLHVRTCFTDAVCGVPSTYQFRVDRDAPTGPITAPRDWATAKGTVDVLAMPADAGSGVSKVEFITTRQGVRTVFATDTLAADGWGARLDTRTFVDGPLSLSVSYTDAVGHVREDAARVNIMIDNSEASPEDWEETVELDGLAVEDSTDAQVALRSGTIVLATRDAEQPASGFDAVFDRVYSSASGTRSTLGIGWRNTYDDVLVEDRDGDVTHVDAAGRERVYARTATGGFQSPDGIQDSLAVRSGGGWTLTDDADSVSVYDAAGRRVTVTDEAGNVLSVRRDGSGRVDSVLVYVQARATALNLTVANLHTYYVLAGGEPVLTHNAKSCTSGNNGFARSGKVAHGKFKGWLDKSGRHGGHRDKTNRVRADGWTSNYDPIELKPNKRLAKIRGKRQLRRYMKENGSDRGELWVYELDGAGEFRFRRAAILRARR